jgi:hypothetical protein
MNPQTSENGDALRNFLIHLTCGIICTCPTGIAARNRFVQSSQVV